MQQRTSYRRHDPLSDAIEGAIAGVILAFAALVKLLAKAIYAYWHELAMLVILAASFWETNRLAGRPVAVVLVGLVVVVPWLPLPKKWMIGRVLATARENLRTMRRVWSLQRKWRTVTAHSDIEGWKLRKVASTPVGDELQIHARRLGTVTPLTTTHQDALAIRLRATQVDITRCHGESQHRATVSIVRRDPFADYIDKVDDEGNVKLDPDGKPERTIRPISWPELGSKQLSGWQPITMGQDKYGRPLRISLFEHNFLVGGKPGAGKSVALSLIAAHCALSPDVKMTLLDGKRADFAAWAPCVPPERFLSGPDRKAAIKILRNFKAELERRQQVIVGHKRRKLTSKMGLPIEVLMIDELSVFLNADDQEGKKDSATIFELLRYICSLGRALGMVLVLATQKPDAKTVDTRLRDQIDTRLAFRCLTYQASDTILGDFAHNPIVKCDASTIPEIQHGVGYLYAEGDSGWPMLMRGYHLSDENLAELASRASDRAIDNEWARAQVPTT